MSGQLEISDLLRFAVESKASDLHISTGDIPRVRVNGDLVKAEGPTPLKADEVLEMVNALLSPEQQAVFGAGKDVDTSFVLSQPGLDKVRFRINAHHSTDGPAIVLRVLDPKIPKLSDLGLPRKVNELIESEKGLLLVTGATGSGKSTSLAAIINELNKKPIKIVTVEDPVEYTHESHTASITHREVGKSVESFAQALKSALRQDPDVILVGEIRDKETAQLAIHAAETGHLVLATVHTGAASHAADRIVDMFSPDDKSAIRSSLSSNLIGVLTQQLVAKADGKGRVAAAELLVATPPVKHLIKDSKTPGIFSAMQIGGKDGMVTMNKSLEALMKAGTISRESFDEAMTNYNRESGMGERAVG